MTICLHYRTTHSVVAHKKRSGAHTRCLDRGDATCLRPTEGAIERCVLEFPAELQVGFALHQLVVLARDIIRMPDFTQACFRKQRFVYTQTRAAT